MNQILCSIPRRAALRLAGGLVAAAALTATAGVASRAQTPAETLLGAQVLKALDEELSGTRMLDHVATLAQIHRVPASPGYHDAATYLVAKARAYGLSDVSIEEFPGDGRTWFGTLKGNRGWRVEGGELREVSPSPRLIGSFDDLNMLVADNSESADVTALLVDVGAGMSAKDYEGKNVRGKLVLCDGSPAACHGLAVEERGAAGLVSYNSNQRTGWWRDDVDLVRWGHLDARGRANTFAMMVSVREARRFQQRLASGETITLRAIVRARNDDSVPYETIVATIPGTNPALGEIVFSCHFDHQKPAANDDASGCAANLEIGRVLKKLVDEKRIDPPARTIRFVWPSEMTGTIAYLTKYPDVANRMKAAIHLDMVGGDPFITKSILHVTRSPWSLATITDDVEAIFARHVIDGAYEGAASGDFSNAVLTAGGSKDALWADFTPYESGSDHWIYQEGSFRIPAIYLRDWPDIYIHTSKDVARNVEPTKLKRSAFIAAASGYYLATLTTELQGFQFLGFVLAGAHERLAEDTRRAGVRMASEAARLGSAFDAAQAREAARADAESLFREAVAREQRRIRSLAAFVQPDAASRGGAPRFHMYLENAASGLAAAARSLGMSNRLQQELMAPRPRTGDTRVPVRNAEVKGPLGPSTPWVAEKAGPGAAALAVNRLAGSDNVTYEIVNFIDGVRTVEEIRSAVSAEFEPIDTKVVGEYLDLLAKIGAIRFR